MHVKEKFRIFRKKSRGGVRFLGGVVLLAMPLAGAHAQAPSTGKTMLVQSGTGFVVSNSGDIITNEHVVHGCKEVIIRGAVPESTAKVIDVDVQYDLALLRTNERVRRIATIRHPKATKIREGEPVLVMGYPLENGVNGQYAIAESSVVGLRGPQEEPQWIQFADAAQQGNSGGPLLDASGNVAGVVVAKSQLRRFNPARGIEEIISSSDLAISLPVLMRFLDRHLVSYRTNASMTYMMPKRLEELAQSYIVNVLCPLEP